MQHPEKDEEFSTDGFQSCIKPCNFEEWPRLKILLTLWSNCQQAGVEIDIVHDSHKENSENFRGKLKLKIDLFNLK